MTRLDSGRTRGTASARRSPTRRGQRAQSLVEASLIMPLLLTIVLIGVDFGRLYASQITVTDAARQAARYAAANPGDQSVASPCGPWKNTVATAQQEAAGSPVAIDCANVGVTAAGPDSYGAKYVTASVKAPFSFVTPFLSPLVHIDHVSGSDTAREFNAAACNVSYSGRAWAVGITGVKISAGLVAITDQLQGDSAALPASGGSVSYSGAQPVSIPGLLSAQLLVNTATGGSCYVSATSKVATVTVLPNAVSGADVLDATALFSTTAMPCGGSPTQSGTVASVKVAGANVPVPLGVNQVVNVPGATLYFNGQQPGAIPPSVDALSVVFPPGGVLSSVIVGTITIAHAQAGC